MGKSKYILINKVRKRLREDDVRLESASFPLLIAGLDAIIEKKLAETVYFMAREGKKTLKRQHIEVLFPK